jgi:outer membrane protein assembly factor BamB
MKIRPSVVLVALALAYSLTADAADWFRWRGPDLNGISKETGWQTVWPADGPRQLWKASVGTGFASFSVANGRVYTSGNANDTDTIFCWDAATGKELWHFSYPSALNPKFYEGGTSATPTVDGGKLYAFGKWGDLFCFDAATGAIIWSTNVAKGLDLQVAQWCFASSPLIEGDLLVLNAGTEGLALNKQTGKVIWSTGKEPAGYATPQPYGEGDADLAIFGGNFIYGVALKDGHELWRSPWKTMGEINVSQPIIDHNRVFISSGYNVGAALLDISGKEPQVIWQNRNMRNHFNSCVLWQGFIYGPDEDQLCCMSFDTGMVKWTDRSVGKGSLMMADGKLVVLSEKGELMVAEASPAGFKPTSRVQVLSGKCWTTPVLSNGRIYCRNARGDVVCLDVSGKP